MQKIERRFKKSTALFLYMYQSVEKTSEFLEDFFLQTGVRLETFGFLPFSSA